MDWLLIPSHDYVIYNLDALLSTYAPVVPGSFLLMIFRYLSKKKNLSHDCYVWVPLSFIYRTIGHYIILLGFSFDVKKNSRAYHVH